MTNTLYYMSSENTHSSYVTDILERHGFNIQPVNDHRRQFPEFERQDVLVMEIGESVANGIQCLNRIIKAINQPRVLLLGDRHGFLENTDSIQGISSKVILTPFPVKDLVESVQTLLSKNEFPL